MLHLLNVDTGMTFDHHDCPPEQLALAVPGSFLTWGDSHLFEILTCLLRPNCRPLLFVRDHTTAALRTGDHGGLDHPAVVAYLEQQHARPKATPRVPVRAVVRQANDAATPPALLRDGVVRPGATLNVFDLAIDPGQIGYARVDYTATLAENGGIAAVVVRFTSLDGAQSADFELSLAGRLDARFRPDGPDSDDRRLHVAFAVPSPNDGFAARGRLAVRVNLKTGELFGAGEIDTCPPGWTAEIIGFTPELHFTAG